MVATFTQLQNMIRYFTTNNVFINDYDFGPVSEIGTTRPMRFPYMWGTTTSPSTFTLENNVFVENHSFSFLFVDQVSNIEMNNDSNGLRSSNAEDIISTMGIVGKSFLDYIKTLGEYGVFLDKGSVSRDYVYDETQDKVYGILLNLVLKTYNVSCEIPFGDGPPVPPEPICVDANYIVEYENGDPIESGTIPSGGNKTIIVDNCPEPETVQLDINGDDIGDFDAGTTINMNINDGTNPITPSNIVVDGNDVTVSVDTTGGFPMLASGTYTPKNTISTPFDLLWTGVSGDCTTGDGYIEKLSSGTDFLSSGYFLIPHYGNFEMFFKLETDGGSIFPFFGLSYYHSRSYYSNLDFGIYNDSVNMTVYENAQFINSFGAANSTTVFSIERDIDTMEIHYKKDGTIMRTVPITNIGSVNGDSSIYGFSRVKDITVVIP